MRLLVWIVRVFTSSSAGLGPEQDIVAAANVQLGAYGHLFCGRRVVVLCRLGLFRRFEEEVPLSSMI